MSTHPTFDAAASAIQTQHPAVLNFKGLHPKGLGKFAMHDKRRGGDLSHIDPRLSAMNEVLHGGPQWIDTVREKIRAARATNYKEHIAALKAKSRHREAAEVEAAGIAAAFLGPAMSEIDEAAAGAEIVRFEGGGFGFDLPRAVWWMLNDGILWYCDGHGFGGGC